jgi:hypothetical protein
MVRTMAIAERSWPVKDSSNARNDVAQGHGRPLLIDTPADRRTFLLVAFDMEPCGGPDIAGHGDA